MANAALSTVLPILDSHKVGDAVQTVNARVLHRFLEVGKDFSTWIKDRIDLYGFNENSDFVVFTEIGENPLGGRPVKEYALTLDMAKELAMVERNARGKEARRYFIECERKLKAGPATGPRELNGQDVRMIARKAQDMARADMRRYQAELERGAMNALARGQSVEAWLAGATVSAKALPSAQTIDLSRFTHDGMGCIRYGCELFLFDAQNIEGTETDVIVARSLSNGENFDAPQPATRAWQLKLPDSEAHPGKRMAYMNGRRENGSLVYDLCYIFGRVLEVMRVNHLPVV